MNEKILINNFISHSKHLIIKINHLTRMKLLMHIYHHYIMTYMHYHINYKNNKAKEKKKNYQIKNR